jgi:hypothetical protein
VANENGGKRVVVGTVSESYLGSALTAARQVLEAAVPEGYRSAGVRSASASATLGLTGMGTTGGMGLPATLATGSPLATFLYTLDRQQRLAIYRYFARNDPFVGRAIDLHSELPLSRLSIGPPKGPNARQNREVNRIYENMVKRLKLLQYLLEVSREFWTVGDVYCHQPGTAVRLSDGTQKAIEDIVVGDEVLNAKGDPATVRQLHQHSVQGPIYEVRARGTTNPLCSTGNHKYHTTRGKVPAEELRVGDKLLFKPPQNEIPQPDITDDHCELMGWYLAEGCPKRLKDTQTDGITFSLCREKSLDARALPRLKEALVRSFPPEKRRTKLRPPWNGESRKTIRRRPLIVDYGGPCPLCGAPNEFLGNGGKTPQGQLRIKCSACQGASLPKELHTMLPYEASSGHDSTLQLQYINQSAHDFFMLEAGEGSHDKRLQARWLFLPKHQQRILLRSWIEGDGVIDTSGYCVGVTTSRALRDQMHLIAARLGINARPFASYEGKVVDEEVIRSLDPDNREVGRFDQPEKFYYALHIAAGEANTKLWESRTLNPRAKTWDPTPDGAITHEITHIEAKAYSGLVYNIGVEGDHTYQVEAACVDNCWHEWDDEIQEWGEIYVLPLEYCHSIIHPFMRDKEVVIYARPLVDNPSIRRMNDRDLYLIAGDPTIEHVVDEIEDDLPDDLKEIMDFGGGHVLNTDPKKGSFVFHLARNRNPNEAYGQGILERCVETLLRLENLKNAQMQITGRNMQPKHLIWGEGIGPTDLGDLRAQVDLAILDNVDYPIVTNYPVHWEIIGAQQRLLDLTNEYQNLYEALATGLCTTREMLTGSATYGGQRITLELMNTQYLTFRQLMSDYVEGCIFQPVAEAKGHYYYEEVDTWIKTKAADLDAGDDVIQEYDGSLRKRRVQVNKVYNHSTLRFNRLSIRDNAEVYDQLFQLHQKGSLALRYLLDIHNIDPEENAAALLEDLMTVRDPTFNRLLESLYNSLAEPILGETDVVDRVIRGLNLDRLSKVQGEPSPGAPPESAGSMGSPGGGGDMLGGGADEGGPDAAGEGAPGAAGADATGGAPEAAPAAAPPTAAARRRKAAQIPGTRLTQTQVRALIDYAGEHKRVTRKEVKKITADTRRSKNGQLTGAGCS